MLVPRADAYQSEDCAPHDNKLEFLSGFTGSAGLALVLQDKALLFVDGRYQVQARHQVDPALFEIHHLHNEPVAQWIAQAAALVQPPRVDDLASTERRFVVRAPDGSPSENRSPSISARSCACSASPEKPA